MAVSLTFPQGWYILLFLSILLWGLFAYHAKKAERKKSLKFGAVGLLFGIFAEAIGIGFGLWSYTGGNWPVALWPSYFVLSAASYLAFRFLSK